MKLKQFLDRSIIAGVAFAHAEIQSWISQRTDLGVSYLGSLILFSLYFEHRDSALGPTRMAATFGCSRGRISQELTRLVQLGMLERGISKVSARNISLKLTTRGERAAVELIRIYAQLQSLIDRKVGEKHAEEMAKSLSGISVHLRSKK